MSKILVLAPSGFGKTISACGCNEQDIQIEGLDPATTYFISETSKDLPRRGSKKLFPVVYPIFDATNKDKITNLASGRRVITSDAYLAAKVILNLIGTPIKNIVIDDANYFMQDYMMDKALATGWDAPKKAGHFMSKLFSAMEVADSYGINIYMLAHYEDKKKNNLGEITFKMKTTGKAVDDYITPEGKFDITLYGHSWKDSATKKVQRVFITNDDGTYPAKSAPGMLPLYVPNSLGYVSRCIEAYYNDEPTPENTVIAPEATVPLQEAQVQVVEQKVEETQQSSQQNVAEQ